MADKPQFKLGKTDARKNAVLFKLSDYLDLAKFPTIPAKFGHYDLFPPKGWLMLGNDRYGDCVFAGAAHETMMWNATAGKSSQFTDSSVLQDYAAVTGFNPNDPNTDNGTDMQVAASYRRKVGIADIDGKRHKVGAYLKITSGDIQEHLLAAYLFGAVGIGIQFPKSAMDQFNAGKPWGVVRNSPIEGGHYVPLVGHNGNLRVVTWGQVQEMTPSFFKKYNDESVVYLSDEMLVNGKSLEGFNHKQLLADLKQLK